MNRISAAMLYLLCTCSSLYPTTLVYSMRIRRLFNIADLLKQERRSFFIGSIVPIFYMRSRHIEDERFKVDVCEKTRMGGSLFNLHYSNKHNWWVEITTGLEHEHSRFKGSSNISAARTGFDDFVFSGGLSVFPCEHGQIVFYGIGGVPSRKKITAQEAQNTLVGTRFNSLGFGSEFSYEFIWSLKRSLIGIAQVRFLHFFERRWFPILPCNALIVPGNITDLLLSLHYREKRHVFEIGYNPTFFSQQAVKLITETIETKTFVRNSFYLDYAYIFSKSLLLKKPLILGGGFSVSKAKKFDSKVFSCYLSISLVF